MKADAVRLSLQRSICSCTLRDTERLAEAVIFCETQLSSSVFFKRSDLRLTSPVTRAERPIMPVSIWQFVFLLPPLSRLNGINQSSSTGQKGRARVKRGVRNFLSKTKGYINNTAAETKHCRSEFVTKKKAINRQRKPETNVF